MRTVNDPIPTNIAIMASLDEVIRFRASVDKLTGTEFDQFILTLMQKCGRDIIITSLFTMFTSERNRSSQTLDTTLNIIKQIIESRKTKPKPANSYEITMQSLPSALIGNLASYLYFTDYESFQTVNRTVYIGCNTPNTLRRLDLSQINDYSQINLAKYLHLTHLSITLNAFNSFILPGNGETVCNRLQKMTLDGAKRSNADITHFITQNTININNVTYLRCNKFGVRQHHFSFDTFTRLLSKFSNIEYLSLNRVVLPSVPQTPSSLLQLLPHLQAFSWVNCRSADFLIQILTTFGSKLKTLKLSNTSLASLPAHVTFSHLQELLMVYPQIATFDRILKTAKYLRRIVFLFYQINTAFPMETSIQRLLTTQPLLEFIAIQCTCFSAFDTTCDGIEHGLYNRNHKNKSIKLTIFVDAAMDIAKYKSILFMFVKITNQLRALDIDDWMFSVDAKSDNIMSDAQWIQKEFHDFEQKHSDMTLFHEFGSYSPSRYRIVVSNAGCTINGIDEPFLWAI
eukprot:354311_1